MLLEDERMTLKINLKEDLKGLVEAMEFIDSIRTKLDYNNLTSVEVYYGNLGRFDLSACIHGFIYEIQSNCYSRGIAFRTIKGDFSE